MEKTLGTNFHFWCFCTHASREYNFLLNEDSNAFLKDIDIAFLNKVLKHK